MRLQAWQVRRLRKYISENRCAVRPGLTHTWLSEIGMDPMSFGGVIEWDECMKCHKVVF